MTAQKEQIQALITEIDSVLQRTTPRLPWVMSGEVAQQRQVLERVRNYLVALQQSDSRPAEFPWLTGGGAFEGPAEQSSQQLMQALLQEMGYLRANLSQFAPNQQQFTADLVQILLGRLQDSVAQQIAQALNAAGNPALGYGHNPALGGGALVNGEGQGLPVRRSDQMMVNLDATLNIVFESLQRNIQAYQESLERGIERMHSLGQQGEMTLKVLLNQLTQQLKADIIAQLQQSQLPSAPMAPPAIANPPEPPPPAPSFPYAGAEVSAPAPASVVSTPPPTSAAPSPLDDQIEAWIQSVSSINWATADQAPTEAESFDLPTVDLSQIELAPVESAPAELAAPAATPPTPTADQPRLAAPKPEATEPANTNTTTTDPATDETASIDAALKLLEDLSAELEESATASLTEAEAQLDQLLAEDAPPAVSDRATSAAPASGPESVTETDQQDELNEFYELFSGYNDAQPQEAQPVAKLNPELNPASVAPEPFEPQAAPPPEEAIDWTAVFAAEEVAAIAEASPEFSVTEARSLDEFFGEPAPPPTSVPPAPPIAEAPLDEFFQPEPSEGAAPPPAPTLDPELFDSLSDFAQSLEAPTADRPQPTPTVETGPPEPVILELPEELFLPGPPTSPQSAPPAAPPDEFAALATEELSFALETGDSLEDLFADIDPAATRTQPAAPPAPPEPAIAPTDTNLLEVEQFFSPNTLFQEEPSELDSQRRTDEDYIRAAPEENLLPDAPVETIDLNVELDDLTLNSLSEDLSQLENSIAVETIELGDLAIAGFEAESDFTLEGLADDITPAAAPTSPEEWPNLDLSQLAQSQPADNGDRDLSAAAPPALADDLNPSSGLDLGFLGTTQTTLSQTNYATPTDSLEEFAAGFAEPNLAEPNLAEPNLAEPNLPASRLDEASLGELDRTAANNSPALDTVPFYQASADIGDLTIEGLSSFLGDDELTLDPPPRSESAFTLDDTAQFFGEAPAVPPTAAPAAPLASDGVTLSDEDWFGDAPPIAPQPSPTETAADTPFTLEGDDLFAETPAIARPSTPSVTPANPLALDTEAATVPFTLEGMDDLFGDAPPTTAPSTTTPPVPPPDDTIGNLFAEAQQVDWSPSPAVESREIPPFRPDLYVTDDTEAAPPFHLEQLDNLFTEPIATPSGPSTSGNTPPSARSRDRQNPTSAKLNEAFESLLGRPGPDADPTQPFSQKKKYLT